MKMDKALDIAKRKYEDGKGGYRMTGRPPYENYMSNESWESYLHEMETNYESAYGAYKNGGGKELEEKQYPPKMASYGSSSRFIYELSRDIQGFEFEKQFSTHIGGKSNLDGFIQKEDKAVCVEAKCREPYGNSHKNEKRKKVYENILKHISNSNIGISFNCQPDGDKIKIISESQYGIIEHFDIIQLVCHFCGIANQILENKISNDICFLYLTYNPSSIPEKYFENGFHSKIIKRYEKCLDEMNSIDFKELFRVIVSFFNKGKQKIHYTFQFIPVDQSNYVETIEKL